MMSHYQKKKKMSNKLSIYELIGKGYERGWYTNCTARYRIFAGARNTKKSVDILGYEIIFKILSNEHRNVLVCRQNDTDNGQSTYSNLVNLIQGIGLDIFFIFRKNPYKIIYKKTGQCIFFKGLNNPTSITSFKVVKGFLTDVYIEEASEVRSYEDFRKIDGSLRGELPDGTFLQLTMVLNPWNIDHWIYSEFFKGRLEDNLNTLLEHDYVDHFDSDFNLGFGKGLYLHKSTYKINEFSTAQYKEAMEELRYKAPELYKVEGLGMWGNSTDATYPEFNDGLIITPQTANTKNYALFAIGIDTGLSGVGKVGASVERIKSATTMQLVGVSSTYSELVAIDEYFYSNANEMVKKTQPELLSEIIDKIEHWCDFYYPHRTLMKGLILVYVDCADIGFRQSLEMEAHRRGLFDVKFIGSTKIKIQTRVDFWRTLMGWGDFLISQNCKNLIREMKNSKRGAKGEPREDFDDHAINAHEYGATPLLKRLQRWANFKEH